MTKNWRQIHPEIKQLYLSEGRPLREVRALMKEKYGFDASARAYKTKFEEWGYKKYERKHHPAGTGRASRNIALDQASATGPGPLTRSYQMAFKAKSTSGPLQRSDSSMHSILRLPDDFRNTEIIFKSILDYFSGSFQGGRWRSFGRLGISCPKTGYIGRYPATALVTQTFQLMARLLERSEGTFAGRSLRRAFIMLEDASAEDNPWALPNGLAYVLILAKEGRSEVIPYLLQHMAAFTAQKLPPFHPRVRMLQALHGSKTEPLQLIRRSWNCILEQLKKFLGVDHLFLFELITGGERLAINLLPEEEKTKIYATLHLLLKGQTPGFAHHLEWESHIRMAIVCFADCALNDQEETEREAKATIDQLTRGRTADGLSFTCQQTLQRCYAYLAKISSHQGDRQLSATYWRLAISVAVLANGWYHPATVRHLLALETELMALGEDVEYREIRQQRIKCLEGFLQGRFESSLL